VSVACPEAKVTITAASAAPAKSSCRIKMNSKKRAGVRRSSAASPATRESYHKSSSAGYKQLCVALTQIKTKLAKRDCFLSLLLYREIHIAAKLVTLGANASINAGVFLCKLRTYINKLTQHVGYPKHLT
jgi:hypothetical protein